MTAQDMVFSQSDALTNLQYRQDVLHHVMEWQETVTNQVDTALQEFKELEQKSFHYNVKIERLRRHINSSLSKWDWARTALEKRLVRNESKLKTVEEEFQKKSNETCFLLEQVTNCGWKDLYPLVKSTMEWEHGRLDKEGAVFSEITPLIENMESTFPQVEEEQKRGHTMPVSFYGTADIIQDSLKTSKPTLFLDDASPYGARAWIALLEKEIDPSQPIGFDVVPVCSVMGFEDPAVRLLDTLGMKNPSSPVLIHNGNVFADSTRISEYIDQAIYHPMYFGKPSLQPSDPLLLFNMKTFMERHNKIADVFFNLMDSKDENSRPRLAKELFELMGVIDQDLRKFQGPFLCGNHFTLADINIFPFMEHIKIIRKFPFLGGRGGLVSANFRKYLSLSISHFFVLSSQLVQQSPVLET